MLFVQWPPSFLLELVVVFRSENFFPFPYDGMDAIWVFCCSKQKSCLILTDFREEVVAVDSVPDSYGGRSQYINLT